MHIESIQAIAHVNSKTEFHLGSAIGISITPLAGIIYGIWLLYRPGIVVKRRRAELERLEFEVQDQFKYSKRTSRLWSSRQFLNAANPERRVRMEGVAIILISLGFLYGVWKDVPHGFFGQ